MEHAHPKFIFICCQVGAEPALKLEIARNHPELLFAFSRPGFVTFKLAEPGCFDMEQGLRSVFARCWGVGIRSLRGETKQRIDELVVLIPSLEFKHLHVWERDERRPGEHGFQPAHGEAELKLGNTIRSSAPGLATVAINRKARAGELVVDLIIIDGDTWFLGWHRAITVASRWPGGIPHTVTDKQVISRAFWKMEEALQWSGLPVRAGDRCVELGSAPGGACQALLERGLHVIGIDPAKMDPRLSSAPRFTHIQARAADLKRKEFAGVRWLMSDANIAPRNTLDAVEHIVTNRRVHISGMLITLKLLDWNMAGQLEEYLTRIRSWNFRYVRARQLAFNRQEICVVAVRRKQIIRQPRIKDSRQRALPQARS